MWLTGIGVEQAGLGGVRTVKAPPSPTTIAHAVLVQWSAARTERRRRTWKSARELALDAERWEVPTRCERGYMRLIPDLAVWLEPSGPPWAVIAESGGRREDRQKMILEGWREAVHRGPYAGVRYDCANESVAYWIRRLAKKVHLTGTQFNVIVQTGADEIAALAAADAEAEERAAREPETFAVAVTPTGPSVQIDTDSSPSTAPVLVEPAEPSTPPPETPEKAAERERRYREIFGIPEPKPRRRWRR